MGYCGVRGFRPGGSLMGHILRQLVHDFMCHVFYKLNPKGPSTQLSYTLETSNLHNYCPKPKYLIIGSFEPLGNGGRYDRESLFLKQWWCSASMAGSQCMYATVG